jgi:hypothetical protein
MYDYHPPETGQAAILRLRADLWRRDAASATNRDLIQLMIQSADELEKEAARMDHHPQAPETP